MRAGYEEFDGSHQEWLRQLLNRVLHILIVVAVLILLICWFLPLIKERQKQQSTVQALQEAVARERALYNKQNKKLTLLQSDPNYLELLARDKLDLMKPGETIFRMESED
ncbi:MAG TPA: septum formation initiator family protein, partial [Chthoniobacterales bacterium]|nr:septum formation initiator family protein [Chthoniobacterales bacterium]